MFLKQNVQHGSFLIHRPPEPMLLTTDLDVDFVQKPPRTPAGFAVPQLFSEQGSKLDVPLSQRFVTDHDATLVQQFLHVTLAEGEAMVQPQSVPDHAEGKTVAIGLRITHSSLTYRD